MEFNTYIRRPFSVEAVEVTESNIEEVAQHVGTIVREDNGVPHIQVGRDAKGRKMIPILEVVHLGYWLTKKDNQLKCYTPRAFEREFISATEDVVAVTEPLSVKK